MTTTYILDIDDFTTKADISPNINTNTLKQYLGITQEKFGVKMLCQAMYDEIIDQLAQGGGEYTYLDAKYVTLMPFIKDYLVYETMKRYYANANYKSTPAGIRQHTDTISEKATDAAMRNFIDQAENDAEFYQDKLQNFLIDNRNTYTLWKGTDCDCSNFSKGTGNVTFGKKTPARTKINWT